MTTDDLIVIARKQVQESIELCKAASLQRSRILAVAQDALSTGGTWSRSDRLSMLLERLEEIVALCEATL